MTEIIYNELDNNNKVFDVFVDLAKAFCTANYKILLKILPYFEIDKISLSWFKSYFLQILKIENILASKV
jgi:hypothetical protein